MSISARDLEESARFYEEVFGLERLPTPTFGNPVVWFRLGDGQLHLFQRSEAEPPQFHHLGMEVDDFEAFYVRLTELGIRDSASLGPIRELPSGEVQMYLRDPGGNLVEIDWPDAQHARPLDRHRPGQARRRAAPGAGRRATRPSSQRRA